MNINNPYLPPESELDVSPDVEPIDAAGVWRERNMLVVRRTGELPDRCVKTNLPARGSKLTLKLVWRHPAWYLLLLTPRIGIALFLIVGMLVRRTAVVDVGLCEDVIDHRRGRQILAWTLIAGGVCAIFGGLAWTDRNVDVGLATTLAGLISVIVGSIVLSTTQLLWTKRIAGDFVWLQGIHRDYLAALPEWPGPESVGSEKRSDRNSTEGRHETEGID